MEKITQEMLLKGGFEKFIMSVMAYRLSKRVNKNEALADVSKTTKLALIDDVINIIERSKSFLVGDEIGVDIAVNNSCNVFYDIREDILNDEEVQGLFHNKAYHVNGLYNIDHDLKEVFEKTIKKDNKKSYLIQSPELPGLGF